MHMPPGGLSGALSSSLVDFSVQIRIRALQAQCRTKSRRQQTPCGATSLSSSLFVFSLGHSHSQWLSSCIPLPGSYCSFYPAVLLHKQPSRESKEKQHESRLSTFSWDHSCFDQNGIVPYALSLPLMSLHLYQSPGLARGQGEKEWS